MAPARVDEPLLDNTPSPLSSSDKENYTFPVTQRAKRKSDQAMPSPALPSESSVTKRTRLTEKNSNANSSTQSQVRPSQRHTSDFYDPDQDVTERREIRKSLRNLTRDLHDYRNEYLQAGNKGILSTIQKANDIFVRVKQTSDATVDSHLLVNAADLSYKKSAQLATDGAVAGIDVDEFVSKCMSFMRQGPTAEPSSIPSSSQRRANRRSDGAESDEDEGDALNWDWLGRAACFPHNARPSLTSFLLGPLSVQKRSRQFTQRRAANRIDTSRVVQPHDLAEEDLDKQETSNLTAMCTSINKLLRKTQEESQNAVNEELSALTEEPTPEEVQEAMDRHNISDDGGIPLFRFCINPDSFGQSVENIFYVSFLVRDGIVGVSLDSRGLPTLQSAKPFAPSEAQAKGVQRHQAVFSLDFDTWEDLVRVYDLKNRKCIIPHRNEEEVENSRPQGCHPRKTIKSLLELQGAFTMSSKLFTGDPTKVMVIRQITPQVTTFSVPFSRFGLIKFGGRGTLVKLATGNMLVVSPVALTPEVQQTIASQGGNIKYIAAPDLEHHIYLSAWKKAFPDADIIAPEGLHEKRQSNPEHKDTHFTHILTKANKHDIHISEEFDREFDIEYVDGHGNKEIVFLHKPTKTMIQADLIFNLPAKEQYSRTNESPTSGIWTKIFSPLISANPPPATWHKRFVWYITANDRKSVGESVARINTWDFDRIIPCHGDVIETGGKAVFQNVFEWFLNEKKL
ncbi:Pyrolysin [Talaromyces islandicus]|uniref:Non-structural maintenance of chromosomes element 4 n=1 Tax=Talaromyces islandicus TaxID=28573 RepID=A0A0U1LW55_TALIS|nr:Pyrolysin [Talaromyces islandicus]